MAETAQSQDASAPAEQLKAKARTNADWEALRT